MPLDGCHGDELARCVDNDNEVLYRQQQKVEQWQQCVQEFTQAELEDVQLILEAIERHIRYPYNPSV